MKYVAWISTITLALIVGYLAGARHLASSLVGHTEPAGVHVESASAPRYDFIHGKDYAVARVDRRTGEAWYMVMGDDNWTKVKEPGASDLTLKDVAGAQPTK